MTLTELLRAERERIVEEASTALGRAHLAHYEEAGASARRARLETLYDLVARTVEERNLTALLRHAEEVARERFAAGFDLMEIQAAFNVLEERIWNTLVGGLPQDELPQAFGLVGTALGAGKDRLATTYVALASRGQVRSLDLSALFRGAAGA